MTRYERRYFNAGRADKKASLGPLGPGKTRPKAHRAYLRGYGS